MTKYWIAAALSAVSLAAQPNAADLKGYLGLTDTQASSLEQIREQARKDLQPLRETMRDKAKAIREQTQAGMANATQLGQMMIDLQNARKQVEPIRTRAHDQALAVLTPDQKTKLTQLQSTARQGKVLRQAARLGLLERRSAAPRARARVRNRI